MPRHFLLPADMAAFEAAWRSTPDKQWVAKKKSHRGVHMVKSLHHAKELAAEGNYMIAEYVEPLLINGHKWDVGIYAAVTRLHPLTIWRYENALFRFCKLPYPDVITNETDVDSYVVNGYKPPWEMPDLKPGYTAHGVPTATSEGTNSWEVVMDYLGSDKSPVPAWSRVAFEQEISRIIVGVLRHVAPKLMEGVLELNTGHPEVFFEMWRWDFTLDTHGKPKLMEVNMSPNLMAKVFPSGTDRAMKFGITRDLLDLVGAGGYTKKALETLRDKRSDRPCKHGGYRRLFLEDVEEDDDDDHDFKSGVSIKDAQGATVAGGSAAEAKASEKLRGFRDLHLCVGRQDCSLRGDCVNSRCACSEGSEGERCEILLLQMDSTFLLCSGFVVKLWWVVLACAGVFWVGSQDTALWLAFRGKDRYSR